MPKWRTPHPTSSTHAHTHTHAHAHMIHRSLKNLGPNHTAPVKETSCFPRRKYMHLDEKINYRYRRHKLHPSSNTQFCGGQPCAQGRGSAALGGAGKGLLLQVIKNDCQQWRWR
jgi:hypothetical protein